MRAGGPAGISYRDGFAGMLVPDRRFIKLIEDSDSRSGVGPHV